MRQRRATTMYCVRVTLTFLGHDKPSTVYLRFRPHGMAKGYSPWTEDFREAKFWLYANHAYAWLNIEKRGQFQGEVIGMARDYALLGAQKTMR